MAVDAKPGHVSSPSEHRGSIHFSARARSYPFPEYLSIFDDQRHNRYDQLQNPEGVVFLGVAENQLRQERLKDRFEQERLHIDLSQNHLSYGHCDGTPELKQALGEVLARHIFHRSQPGIPAIQPERLLVANGCCSLLGMLGLALVDSRHRLAQGAGGAPERDAIMYFSPRYPGFCFDFAVAEACLVEFRRDPATQGVPSNEELDDFVQRLRNPSEDKASTVVRALLLCSPDNPTGLIWAKKDLLRLVSWCRSQDILLISDEIYAGSCNSVSDALYGDEGDDKFFSLYRHADVTLWGLSKDFGACGFRCAVMYSEHKELLEMCGQYAEPFQLPAFAQNVLARVLGDEDFVHGYMAQLREELQRSKELALEELRRLRIPVAGVAETEAGTEAEKGSAEEAQVAPQERTDRLAGMFLWLDFSEFGIPADQLFQKLLLEYKLFLSPGASFFDDLGGQVCFHMRLCYGAEDRHALRVGLDRLGRFVDEHRKS